MSNPIKTPELRGIFELLILPALRNRPDSITHEDWLDLIWCTQERSIRRWKVTKKFIVEAQHRVFHNKWFKKTLKLKRGDEIFSRMDIRNPGVVELEVMHGIGRVNSQQYKIKEKDWRRLEVYLKHCIISEKDEPCTIDWAKLVS